MLDKKIEEFIACHSTKKAEIGKKHQKSRSQSETWSWGMVAGWVLIFCGILVATITDLYTLETLVTILIGTGLAWACHYAKRKLPDFEKQASDEWTSFYASWDLLTPAGEKVLCRGADFGGRHLYVQYEDGSHDKWPISFLRNNENQYYRSSPTFEGDAGILVRMSKCQWRTPDGRIGTVRNARSVYEGETCITLAFPGGKVSDFKLSDIEPVTGVGIAA